VPARKGALHAALVQLAEQDPLIDLRRDDLRHELNVSLYGEVQKSVIQATLADEYGIHVDFRETTTVCIERPFEVGEALEVRGKGVNPFAASVGLRIEPAAPGSGLVYRSEIGVGSIPLAFLTAVEDSTRETLRQGLHGWEVTDCLVTLTVCDHRPPPVPVGGFRNLTPLVAMAALARAGTTVCEPIHRFRLELPGDSVNAALAVLARLEGVPDSLEPRGWSWALEGEVRAVRVDELQQQVPGLTGGEGVLESAFDSYRPVIGDPPTRPRSDHNPLNRDEYLLHVAHRVQAGSDS
jgi:ribosomal protection tetracycline resistance protein